MKNFILIAIGVFTAINSWAGAVPAGAPIIGTGATGLIGPTSNIPLSNPAGGTFSTPGAYATFSLHAGSIVAPTVGNYYPLYKNGTAYHVSSGLNMGAICFDMVANTYNSGGQPYQLMSATASFAYNAGSVTGGVYQCGSSGTYCEWSGLTVNRPDPVPGIYIFGANTYAGYQAGTTNTYGIHMTCYEY